MRIVVDANVILSASVFGGVPLAAFRKAQEGVILGSAKLFEEVLRNAAKPSRSMDKRFPAEVRSARLESVLTAFEVVTVTTVVRECHDEKDDYLLALALDGGADVLMTGDRDLLTMHPWRGIAILTPAEFLARS